MNKLIFLVVVSSFFNCFAYGGRHCPDYKPMANLTMSKILGTWYTLAYDFSGPFQNDSCTKATFTQQGTDTLVETVDRITNGKRENVVINFKEDLNRPGVISIQEEHDVYNIFGMPSKQKLNREILLAYTDYDNLAVFYSCLEIKHFWYTQLDIGYAITKRDRAFDSLSKILPILETAAKNGADMNRLVFEKNDNTCTN